MMMIFYFSTGALIAAFLSLYSEKQERLKSASLSQYVTACALTILFWPVVLVLSATHSSAFRERNQLSLTQSDLVSRVDPSLTMDIPKNFSRTWSSNDDSIEHQIWTFRTHNERLKFNTTIVEGYAIVNAQDVILDYVVLDEYPEQLSLLH